MTEPSSAPPICPKHDEYYARETLKTDNIWLDKEFRRCYEELEQILKEA